MSKQIDPNSQPDMMQDARSWVVEELKRLRKLVRKNGLRSHDLLSWRKVKELFLNGKKLVEASYRELIAYWIALGNVNAHLAAHRP